MLYLTTTVRPGTTLLHAIEDALVLANKFGCGIEFTFNGYLVPIRPGMDAQEEMHWLTAYWEKVDALKANTAMP
jgi:hypothetical protein